MNKRDALDIDTEIIPLENHQNFTDLGLAAALICAGYLLIALNRENPNRVQFVFRNSENIDKTATAYWQGDLNVIAREYFDTIKMLKNRLYSE